MEFTESGTQNQREHLAKGDIVRMPAKQVNPDDPKEERMFLILWRAEVNTYTVCPITSSPYRKHKIALERRDLRSGALTCNPSYMRPNMVSTMVRKDDWKKVGSILEEKMSEVSEVIKNLLDQEPEPAPVPKALERPARQRIR